jgi:WD40 repeat protein
VVSASWDHTAKVWDCESRRELLTFSGHTAPVHAVAFSPDGKRVVSGAFDGQIKIWDSASGKVITSCDGFIFPVMTVAFSPDGKRVASGGGDRALKIWDAETGKLLFSLKAHSASIHSVAFSPDGTRVASASWDKNVRVWDVTPDRRVRVWGATPRGGTVPDREVGVLILKGRANSHDDRVNSVVFSHDGKRIATASEDKTVRVWDAETGKECAAPPPGRCLVDCICSRRQATGVRLLGKGQLDSCLEHGSRKVMRNGTSSPLTDSRSG